MTTAAKNVLLFLVTAGLGVCGIVAAVLLGKPWQLADVVYDLAIALLTIAVVELLIVRVLRELAARKTEIERLTAALEASTERSNRRMEAIDQSMRDVKLDNVFTTLHKMDQLLTLKLKEIAEAIAKSQPRSPGPQPPGPSGAKP